MKRYRYIFILAIFALAFTACVKDDFDTTTTIDQEIRFTTSVEATRATETDITALQTYGKFNIATFKDNTDTDHYYTDIVNYSGGSWSAENKRYWPAYDSLNMVAYSPLEEDYSALIAINNPTSYSDYSLTYTCPPKITDQIDLLVKTLESQSPKGGAVPLAFEHALSGIRFNIQINDETHVTLNTITLNYRNIVKEATYNFSDELWSYDNSTNFDLDDGLSTYITLDQTKKRDSGDSDLTFNYTDYPEDTDGLLMIIPQPISDTESDPHYISVQIAYNLVDGSSTLVEEGIDVITGVMPLPAPNTDSYYKQGEIYTYNIIVNGEKVTFGDITIEDQEEPVAAYGNIDLTLITDSDPMTMDAAVPYIDDYGIIALDNPSGYGSGYGIYDSKYDVYVEFPKDDKTGSYVTESTYFAVAQRVSNLLKSGVRDFVVVGEVGSSSSLGNGKMGYHGSGSNPFSLGALNAEKETSDDYQFSVDLRGTYNYPTLTTLHGSSEGLDAEVANKEAIPEGFFQGVKRLTEVIVPNGIAAIGSYAFDACDGLTAVEIPDVLHVEEGGFNDCINLETVTGDNLTRIHAHGFEDCSKLTSINLSSVTEIDMSGFSNCSSLGFVDIADVKIIAAYAFGGCTKLNFGDADATYSFIATEIGNYAFQNCPNIGTIDISNVTYIGNSAFNGNEHLTLSFSVPSTAFANLTYIGDYAFQRAENASDVNGGIEAMYAGANVTYIGNGAFSNCHKLYFVDGFNDYTNVVTIGSNAFISCTTLGELDITNASTIGSYAFYDCGNFKLPTDETSFDNLTSLGAGAFNNCSSLNGSLSFPNIDTLLAANTFNGASSVTKLYLPTITKVGKYGLSGLTSLTSIYMPNLTTVDVYDEEEGEAQSSVTSMLSSAASTLTDMELGIKALSYQLFKNFAVLKKLTLKNITAASDMGWDAFSGCENLEELDLSGVSDDFSGNRIRVGTDSDGNNVPSTSIKKLLLTNAPSVSSIAITSLEYLDISSSTSTNWGLLGSCFNLTYIDMSSPDLAVINNNANPFAGLPEPTEDDPTSMSNCTLVIDKDYVTKWTEAAAANDSISFEAPDLDNNTWLSITFKEIVQQ